MGIQTTVADLDLLDYETNKAMQKHVSTDDLQQPLNRDLWVKLQRLQSCGLMQQFKSEIHYERRVRLSQLGFCEVTPEAVVRALAKELGQHDRPFAKTCQWDRYTSTQIHLPTAVLNDYKPDNTGEYFIMNHKVTADVACKKYKPARRSIWTHGIFALLHVPAWTMKLVPIEDVFIPSYALERIDFLRRAAIFNGFFAITHEHAVGKYHMDHSNFTVALACIAKDLGTHTDYITKHRSANYTGQDDDKTFYFICKW